MPVALPTKVERERKLKSLLAFASTLESRFERAKDSSLIDELQSHTSALPLRTSPAVIARQDELDKLGTELWNLSTQLRRKVSESEGSNLNSDAGLEKQSICLLRVFSFLLLDTANSQASKAQERKCNIRLARVAIRAARTCIECNDLVSATKVLERATDYQDALGCTSNKEGDEEAEVGRRLRIEYLAIRTSLAWRQDRMDTAEHMFAKMRKESGSIDNSTAETVADLLYEMGKDMLGRRKYELATRWLERAFDVLGEKDLEVLSSEAGELRQSIMQSIVQASIGIRSPEAQQKAWNMLSLLENDYAEKMAVSLLKLELISSSSEKFDANQYYDVLGRMIRFVVLNDTNFKTVIHCVHKLKDRSQSDACTVLDDLIVSRLFREENQAWIERAVITRVWIGTFHSPVEEVLESLQALFDNVSHNTKSTFSPPATHAAQTLLWKRVEAAYAQEQWALAESWCRTCLHPLFERAGELNKSKIARKMMACALSRHDYTSARHVFDKLSNASKDDPLTRYLMFKISLRLDDQTLAADCLDHVCRQSSKEPTLLYSCVIEAQNAGNRRIAITALERVLDKYDYRSSEEIHLPALLRCTARLLRTELVNNGKVIEDVLEELCKIFDGACAQARSCKKRPSHPQKGEFNALELEWFSKTAYNLAISHCTDMHPQHLIRLLDACTEFIRLLKAQELESGAADGDLQLRLIFCHFLSSCSLTTLARAEDNVQDRLQFYLNARKHSHDFRRIAAEELEKQSYGDSARNDLIAKYCQIVKLELEAVLKLKKWDDFEELFEACWKYRSPEHYQTLADLLLVIYSCAEKEKADRTYKHNILAVLQKLINQSLQLKDGGGITTLARWIRCLFQLAIDFDESISLRCLDQAAQIAAVGQGVSHHPLTPPPSSFSSSSPSISPMKSADHGPKEANHYPRVELEWMATTSFNRAIDHYLQEDDTKCKTWAEKALNLAQWAEDKGALKSMLMERYSGLTWDK